VYVPGASAVVATLPFSVQLAPEPVSWGVEGSQLGAETEGANLAVTTKTSARVKVTWTFCAGGSGPF
jgi:hypothetical protein